jgi:uncharacterized phage protein gp47/JayE
MNLEELITPITEDQALETFLEALETLGVPARSWRRGAGPRVFLRVVARTFASYSQLIAAITRGGFLDYAAGHWLTLLARHVYGVERIPATFASGAVTFTNTGGGVFAEPAGQVTALWTVGRRSYVNTEPVVLGVGATGTFAFQAVEAGSASSVPATQINALETVMPHVTVSNAVALVGRDEEDDPTLRQRCLDRLASLSPNGPRGAYAFAVRSAVRSDGSAVDINRVRVSPASSVGIVTVTVAAPGGVPVASDLTAIRLRIDTVARPDSVRVDVGGASSLLVARSLTVWARSTPGLTEAAVKAAADRALLELGRDWPIGGIAKTAGGVGYLYADAVKGAVKASHPAIFDVDGFDTDQALGATQIAGLSCSTSVRFVEVST